MMIKPTIAKKQTAIIKHEDPTRNEVVEDYTNVSQEMPSERHRAKAQQQRMINEDSSTHSHDILPVAQQQIIPKVNPRSQNQTSTLNVDDYEQNEQEDSYQINNQKFDSR